MKKILVTGATGFIGKSICQNLLKSGRSFSGSVRSINLDPSDINTNYISVGDIGPNTEWKVALEGVECIIHCAGRAHVMKETKTNELKIYRSVNVEGTKRLAEQAAKAGVKRLVFLSSIKVNGEVTGKKQINTVQNNIKNKYNFQHTDTPNPKNSYAISKLETEKMLFDLSAKINLEVVVVRLPLVYGKGVKGNLARLIKLIKSNTLLPLSSINNQRSMIGIDNLVDLLIRCSDHPNASGKTFLVSDGDDLSTPDLINYIASSMGKRVNLFPFPLFLLKFIGSIIGKREEINRLVDSLKIDNNYTKETLNWKPIISVEEGIKRMVDDI
tara:strand:- start:410 stop:1393 length:984 start_codon:yes stop_codon:yes gene_type:complete